MTEITPPAGSAAQETRKPRIAIMGEFSAGKSTLSNLLLGTPALPVKVTATQLPPVWISQGDEAPYSVDLSGNRAPVDLGDIAAIPVAETQYLRVFHQAETLDDCDLIDMPGISDPNMPAEVWERVAGMADAVIWCTHATQAWRQSEAAVWATFPPDLHMRSLLLLTRFDKIVEDRDRKRLVRRVATETEGLFRGVYPISLTRALAAGEDDFDAWKACGADAFALALADLSAELASGRAPVRPQVAAAVAAPRAPAPQPSPPPEAAPEGRVIPQRVARRGNGGVRRIRPAGDADSLSG